MNHARDAGLTCGSGSPEKGQKREEAECEESPKFFETISKFDFQVEVALENINNFPDPVRRNASLRHLLPQDLGPDELRPADPDQAPGVPRAELRNQENAVSTAAERVPAQKSEEDGKSTDADGKR